jgi:hypothetical protein
MTHFGLFQTKIGDHFKKLVETKREENELKQRGEQGLKDNNHACSSKAICEIVSFIPESDFEEQQDQRTIFNKKIVTRASETQTEDGYFEDDSIASSVVSDDDSDASDNGALQAPGGLVHVGSVAPFAHRTLVTSVKRLRELERQLAFFGTAHFV